MDIKKDEIDYFDAYMDSSIGDKAFDTLNAVVQDVFMAGFYAGVQSVTENHCK